MSKPRMEAGSQELRARERAGLRKPRSFCQAWREGQSPHDRQDPVWGHGLLLQELLHTVYREGFPGPTEGLRHEQQLARKGTRAEQ